MFKVKYIDKEWLLKEFTKNITGTILEHRCPNWDFNDDARLPRAIYESGSGAYSALWDGESFWCSDCGVIAPNNVVDVALLAGAIKKLHKISDRQYATRFGRKKHE